MKVQYDSLLNLQIGLSNQEDSIKESIKFEKKTSPDPFNPVIIEIRQD